jgi:hypothetical protein
MEVLLNRSDMLQILFDVAVKKQKASWFGLATTDR